MEHATHPKRPPAGAATLAEALAPVREKLQACIQCGTCTGSCPNAFAMDLNPRQMWRMAIVGLAEPIFKSRTFTLCSACYTCTLRCPRGLPLTEAMSDLKQVAARMGLKQYQESTGFYKCFMESVRKHGRVKETEFISTYFMAMTPRKPLLPLKYTPLGIQLMKKGKLKVETPFSKPGPQNLAAVFDKVAEMEATP